MNCIVGGNPPPEVNWTKNGLHLVNTSNSFTIFYVSFEDAGQYGCMAENRVGKTYKSIWIDVTGKTYDIH